MKSRGLYSVAVLILLIKYSSTSVTNQDLITEEDFPEREDMEVLSFESLNDPSDNPIEEPLPEEGEKEEPIASSQVETEIKLPEIQPQQDKVENFFSKSDADTETLLQLEKPVPISNEDLYDIATLMDHFGDSPDGFHSEVDLGMPTQEVEAQLAKEVSKDQDSISRQEITSRTQQPKPLEVETIIVQPPKQETSTNPAVVLKPIEPGPQMNIVETVKPSNDIEADAIDLEETKYMQVKELKQEQSNSPKDLMEEPDIKPSNSALDQPSIPALSEPVVPLQADEDPVKGSPDNEIDYEDLRKVQDDLNKEIQETLADGFEHINLEKLKNTLKSIISYEEKQNNILNEPGSYIIPNGVAPVSQKGNQSQALSIPFNSPRPFPPNMPEEAVVPLPDVPEGSGFVTSLPALEEPVPVPQIIQVPPHSPSLVVVSTAPQNIKQNPQFQHLPLKEAALPQEQVPAPEIRALSALPVQTGQTQQLQPVPALDMSDVRSAPVPSTIGLGISTNGAASEPLIQFSELQEQQPAVPPNQIPNAVPVSTVANQEANALEQAHEILSLVADADDSDEPLGFSSLNGFEPVYAKKELEIAAREELKELLNQLEMEAEARKNSEGKGRKRSKDKNMSKKNSLDFVKPEPEVDGLESVEKLQDGSPATTLDTQGLSHKKFEKLKLSPHRFDRLKNIPKDALRVLFSDDKRLVVDNIAKKISYDFSSVGDDGGPQKEEVEEQEILRYLNKEIEASRKKEKSIKTPVKDLLDDKHLGEPYSIERFEVKLNDTQSIPDILDNDGSDPEADERLVDKKVKFVFDKDKMKIGAEKFKGEDTSQEVYEPEKTLFGTMTVEAEQKEEVPILQVITGVIAPNTESAKEFGQKEKERGRERERKGLEPKNVALSEPAPRGAGLNQTSIGKDNDVVLMPISKTEPSKIENNQLLKYKNDPSLLFTEKNKPSSNGAHHAGKDEISEFFDFTASSSGALGQCQLVKQGSSLAVSVLIGTFMLIL